MALTTPRPAASANPAAHARLSHPSSLPTAHASPGIRHFEVAALRPDGSLMVKDFTTPALPLFESAFSAFARGTVLQSDAGPVAIEDLQPGDHVMTAVGAPSEVVWIGSSTFVPSDAGRRMPLVRIMADSFGMNRPANFVTVGPSARLLQTPQHLRAEFGGSQMLTPASAFVDGVNVIEVVPPTPVHLFHICLRRHAAIIVGGLEMETFHPGANATRAVSHTLRDLFLSMFPHINHVTDFGALAHPRAPEPPSGQTAA